MPLFFNPLQPLTNVATVVHNIGVLVHLDGPDLVNDDELISTEMAVVVNDGVIVRVGPSSEVVNEYGEHGSGDHAIIDAGGRAVVPGFIDTHTHLLWGGDRSREVGWRHEGKSYIDIADLGGGIASTVAATRRSSQDAMFSQGMNRMKMALRSGTTHMEAKSGYGLSTPSELDLLNTMDRLHREPGLPSLDITWMGAHDAPPGTTIDEYTETLLSEQLPAVVDQGIARSMDVFCEPGWFSVEQTSALLTAGKQDGLALRLHIDEFTNGGGGDLAVEYKVQTADHAYHTPLETRMAMTEAGVNIGYLPGTPYAMGEAFPNMREVIDSKLHFTLATDFNPNCQTLSLPFMGSLMVQRAGVHPMEALKAVTCRAATTSPHPSGLEHGVIREGAVANLNILKSPHWESWSLQPSHSPVWSTMLEGEMVQHSIR